MRILFEKSTVNKSIDNALKCHEISNCVQWCANGSAPHAHTVREGEDEWRKIKWLWDGYINLRLARVWKSKTLVKINVCVCARVSIPLSLVWFRSNWVHLISSLISVVTDLMTDSARFVRFIRRYHSDTIAAAEWLFLIILYFLFLFSIRISLIYIYIYMKCSCSSSLSILIVSHFLFLLPNKLQVTKGEKKKYGSV